MQKQCDAMTHVRERKQWWNVSRSSWYVSRNMVRIVKHVKAILLNFCYIIATTINSRKNHSVTAKATFLFDRLTNMFIQKRCFLLMRRRLFRNRRFILAYYSPNICMCVIALRTSRTLRACKGGNCALRCPSCGCWRWEAKALWKFEMRTWLTANELRCREQQIVSAPRYDSVCTPSGDHTLSAQPTHHMQAQPDSKQCRCKRL